MNPSPAVSADEKESLQKPDERLTFGDVWLIAVACAAVSAVVAAMASLNVALPDIAPDIKADNTQITWIVDGYTLALAALLLPFGALGDRFGRRGILIVGLMVFGVASLLPVWISDPNGIIATRVLAGVGAAFVMPATLSLITSGVPSSKQPIAVSIWAAVAGVGAIGGFFVTGLLLEFFSWHSIFITFGAAALAMILAALTIGSTKDPDPPAFDIIGSITSAVAIAGLVFGLIEGPTRGWDDPLVLGMIIGGLLLGVVFVYLQIHRDRALLDVNLFRNRAFGAGSFVVAMQFMGSFGIFFLLLQRFQLVMGYSPLGSAVAMLPIMLMTMVMSLVGNWLAVRFNFRAVLAIGLFIFGAGIILFGVLSYDEYWKIVVLLLIMAFGLGMTTAPSTTGIMVNTPADNHGVGSAINDTARELGAAIGIALAGSIVAAGYAHRIGSTAESARVQLEQTAAGLRANGQGVQAQLLSQQSDTIVETIKRSLAEASAVADQLRGQIPGPLANDIASGAQDAFIAPLDQAYTVLGAILVVGSVIVAFWAPNRVDQN